MKNEELEKLAAKDPLVKAIIENRKVQLSIWKKLLGAWSGRGFRLVKK